MRCTHYCAASASPELRFQCFDTLQKLQVQVHTHGAKLGHAAAFLLQPAACAIASRKLVLCDLLRPVPDAPLLVGCPHSVPALQFVDSDFLARHRVDGRQFRAFCFCNVSVRGWHIAGRR